MDKNLKARVAQELSTIERFVVEFGNAKQFVIDGFVVWIDAPINTRSGKFVCTVDIPGVKRVEKHFRTFPSAQSVCAMIGLVKL